MKLIVGLGNPGAEYANTRHNVGFMVVDRLCARWSVRLQGKFKGEVGRGELAGQSCILLKPLTYMNRSGISVGLTREYFHVPAEDLIVVQDEVDLPFGRLRLKQGGGHAGHNGLRSIIESIGSREFVRVRIGIGRPVHGSMADFVLARWKSDEVSFVEDLIERSTDAVEALLCTSLTEAMNRYNGDEPPEKRR